MNELVEVAGEGPISIVTYSSLKNCLHENSLNQGLSAIPCIITFQHCSETNPSGADPCTGSGVDQPIFYKITEPLFPLMCCTINTSEEKN